ncbi:MAG: FGGY family carbohydrate kinase [Eubacteriales bacterium]|nr:FGGY family carbohydrate kinase [Eubacteriales bacterium]
MKEYLAFDLGASSGKIIRGSFEGEILTLSQEHVFPNQIIQLGEGLYWDFLNIFDQMRTGLQKAAARKPFDSFGVDSFNNDFSFISPGGGLLQPVRSYRDPRTRRHEEAIYQKISRRDLYRLTGNQLAPFNTFMQLAAMREDGEDAWLDRGARLLFLPDLMGYYLTGEQYTEYSVAAETQMLDWDSRDWIEELLKLLDIRRETFAPIVMPGSIAGQASASFLKQNGLPTFRHVAVCEHDTASAFLAAPAGADTATLSCGTWTILGAENDRPVITDFGFRHNIANEGSLKGHHRICYNVMGLWILQQLKADMASQGQLFTYGEIQESAIASAPFQAIINPDDPVFYPPGRMEQTLRENTLEGKRRMKDAEPGLLFRMVYESLALQYRWALSKLETLLARKLGAVSLIGGGARDKVLCQFTANALNLPVIAGPVEASSAGNILVQMLADSAIASICQGRDIIRKSFDLTTYLPRDVPAWNEQYQRFLTLAHPEEE